MASIGDHPKGIGGVKPGQKFGANTSTNGGSRRVKTWGLKEWIYTGVLVTVRPGP